VENALQDNGTVLIGVCERPQGVFPAGNQMTFLRKWDRPPSTYGFVNFRATLEAHAAQVSHACCVSFLLLQRAVCVVPHDLPTNVVVWRN